MISVSKHESNTSVFPSQYHLVLSSWSGEQQLLFPVNSSQTLNVSNLITWQWEEDTQLLRSLHFSLANLSSSSRFVSLLAWTLVSVCFVQASQGCSLCSFGGSFSPEVRYALGRYHAGRQNIDPNQVLFQTAWGCISKSSLGLPFSLFFQPWPDSQFQTHWNIILPLPCFTLGTVFFGLSFFLQT